MKKLMIIAVLVFAFAITLNVALAFGGYTSGQTNVAIGVSNDVTAISDSGNNEIEKICINGDASIDTGNANASATGINAINTSFAMNKVYGGQKNIAKEAMNSVGAQSTTGNNEIEKGKIGGSASITTGMTISKAKGINLINTSIKIGCPCYGSYPCNCAR